MKNPVGPVLRMGDDPDYEAWTRDYAGRPADGIAPVARS